MLGKYFVLFIVLLLPSYLMAKSSNEKILAEVDSLLELVRMSNLLTILSLSTLALLLLIIIILWRFHKKKKKEALLLKTQLDDSLKDIEEKKKKITVLEQRLNDSFEEIIDLAKSNHPSLLKRFREVYPEPTKRLYEKHPNLSGSELVLCIMIVLNFSTKDIANYTFVEYRTVQTKKSRLRKKLGLPAGSSLEHYLHSFAEDSDLNIQSNKK